MNRVLEDDRLKTVNANISRSLSKLENLCQSISARGGLSPQTKAQTLANAVGEWLDKNLPRMEHMVGVADNWNPIRHHAAWSAVSAGRTFTGPDTDLVDRAFYLARTYGSDAEVSRLLDAGHLPCSQKAGLHIYGLRWHIGLPDPSDEAEERFLRSFKASGPITMEAVAQEAYKTALRMERPSVLRVAAACGAKPGKWDLPDLIRKLVGHEAALRQDPQNRDSFAVEFSKADAPKIDAMALIIANDMQVAPGLTNDIIREVVQDILEGRNRKQTRGTADDLQAYVKERIAETQAAPAPR